MTRAWSRIESGEYEQLPLRAHTLLKQVPLHDVWRVDLPGGGPNRTVEDIRVLLARLRASGELNWGVRGLFRMRSLLGVLFRWDRADSEEYASPYNSRLTPEDRRESLVRPGTVDGPFRVLYVRAHESLGEIRNATVHAFLAMALRPTETGYRLYWAIYVRPVGLISPLYMAAIDPFRRLFVYPAILRHIHRAWVAAYTSSAGNSGGSPKRAG
ncbi:MAG: DUF2867 domain-containing protein [Gemmatimonadota bacterium]